MTDFKCSTERTDTVYCESAGILRTHSFFFRDEQLRIVQTQFFLAHTNSYDPDKLCAFFARNGNPITKSVAIHLCTTTQRRTGILFMKRLRKQRDWFDKDVPCTTIQMPLSRIITYSHIFDEFDEGNDCCVNMLVQLCSSVPPAHCYKRYVLTAQ
jgi:hypothetical protein